MSDEILLIIGEDGKASLYDDTYDITIHCESKEEQDKVKRILQNEPHWIPVTQALPEDDTVVLVCGKSGGIYTAIYNNSKAWVKGWWKMNSKNHHCNPIAWMSLPESYKEVTK